MCERTPWTAGHFGLAVDKAVLDALLTSRVEHGHAWRAAPGDLQPARAYLAELHRLLEPGARPNAGTKTSLACLRTIPRIGIITSRKPCGRACFLMTQDVLFPHATSPA